MKEYNSCETPIFLIGLPRSGTQLFREILNNHDNIYFTRSNYCIYQSLSVLVLVFSLMSMELTQCQYSQICHKYGYPIGNRGNTITVASKKLNFL